VGAILSEQHLIRLRKPALNLSRADLQVDGGHIPIKSKLNAALKLYRIVYRPESLQVVDQHHREISTNPVCSQPKMTVRNNEELRAAAHQQGMKTQLSQR